MVHNNTELIVGTLPAKSYNISGFTDDVMFSCSGHNGGVYATTAASLQCRVRPNPPAAWCWLHTVQAPRLDESFAKRAPEWSMR